MQKQLCYSLKGGGGGSGRSRWMTSWLMQHWTRHHSGFPRLFHLNKGQAAHYTTAALTLKFRAKLCLTLSSSDCFLIICTNLCFHFSYSSSVSTGRAYALSGHSDAPSFQMTTNGVKDLYRPLYITCLLSQHLVWLNTDSSREQTCPMLLSFTAWLPLQSSDTKLIEQVHNTIRWLELLKALTVCLLTRVRACSLNPKDSLPCKTLGVDIKPPPVNLVCCVRRWHKMSGLFTVIEIVGVLFWDPVLHHTLPHALISPTSCTVDWKTVRNRVYAWNSLQAKSISHSVLYMLRQLFYLFLFLCRGLTNLGNTLLHVRYRGNNICWSLLGWYR